VHLQWPGYSYPDAKIHGPMAAICTANGTRTLRCSSASSSLSALRAELTRPQRTSAAGARFIQPSRPTLFTVSKSPGPYET
jgi:hypothetical protein